MKKFRVNFGEYLISIFGIIAGVLLAIFPQESVNIITYGIGAVSIIYGIMKVVSYLQNRVISFYYAGELVMGIILVGIGIFCFTNPGGIFAILPIILGILVLIEGVSKIQRALMLKNYQYPRWGTAMVLGAAITGLGLMLVINPFEALVVTVRILGIVLVGDGIAGLWVSLALRKFS